MPIGYGISPDIARVVRNEFTLQFGAVTGVLTPVFRPESVVPARFCGCWAHLPLTPVVYQRAGAALGDGQEVSRGGATTVRNSSQCRQVLLSRIRIRRVWRSTTGSAAELGLHLTPSHGRKTDRILVTFRHGKISYDILCNRLNDVEFIGVLPPYSCNIRTRWASKRPNCSCSVLYCFVIRSISTVGPAFLTPYILFAWRLYRARRRALKLNVVQHGLNDKTQHRANAMSNARGAFIYPNR